MIKIDGIVIHSSDHTSIMMEFDETDIKEAIDISYFASKYNVGKNICKIFQDHLLWFKGSKINIILQQNEFEELIETLELLKNQPDVSDFAKYFEYRINKYVLKK